MFTYPILVAYLIINIGLATYISRLVGKRISPSWVGYTLGFVAGVFIGYAIYQLMIIISVVLQFNGETNLLGDTLFDMILFPVINLVVISVICAVLITILIALVQHKQH